MTGIDDGTPTSGPAAERHPVHDRIAALADPQPGDLVADLGCGMGGTLAALAERAPDARLIGYDLRPKSLEIARARVPRATLDVADLSKPLPLEDGSVDVAVCHNVLELLPEPVAVLREVARVLRPAGRAAVSHTIFASLIIHGADPGLTARIVAAYAHVRQDWMTHIDPYTGQKLPGWAREAGLTVDRVDAHVLVDHRLDGAGRHRVDEVTGVVQEHIRQGRVDLTEADIDDWTAQLRAADDHGKFLFAETALITVASPAN